MVKGIYDVSEVITEHGSCW